MEQACPLSHPQREKRRQATLANQQQLDLLKQGGTETWKRWRQDHPDTPLELKGVDLSGADLGEVNLAHADLSRADLSRADLNNANLSETNLVGANSSQDCAECRKRDERPLVRYDESNTEPYVSAKRGA
jgi:uncharacterized protein YjbI with pentapeptide repeats